MTIRLPFHCIILIFGIVIVNYGTEFSEIAGNNILQFFETLRTHLRNTVDYNDIGKSISLRWFVAQYITE